MVSMTKWPVTTKALLMKANKYLLTFDINVPEYNN